MILGLELGTDCEEVLEWHGLDKTAISDPRYSLFSVREHEYCSGFDDPAPHYAGKWCAKEALQKAIFSVCPLDLRKVEVLNDEKGKPFFAGVQLPDGLQIALSLSHSRSVAFAVVVATTVNPSQVA